MAATILVDKDRNELIARLKNVKTTMSPAWGIMIPAEMLLHLTHANGAYNNPPGAFEDISTFISKTLFKWMTLSSIPIPKGKIKTHPAVDMAIHKFPLGDFNEVVKLNIDILNTFNEDKQFSGSYHPVFGDLTREQWGRLIYKHTDHHLTQFGC
jgi:hypothetical protein